ncbi:hypothetical protein ACFPYI_11355 [Halomarina salina]|uniref:Uncharacterized protein n=1 Tax=Halomarina salina TaxID=1872699 RepID=A0ABD5RNV2_9EURY|nr:hypothetical protein [Halomarina salina]
MADRNRALLLSTVSTLVMLPWLLDGVVDTSEFGLLVPGVQLVGGLVMVAISLSLFRDAFADDSSRSER